MRVSNSDAATMKHALAEDGMASSDAYHLCLQLLADRKLLFVLYATEQGELTEKQAADMLGLDRLDFRRAREEAEAVIKDATRVQRTSGQIGSWGRCVARSWQCDFDPTGGGCECAGCGYTEDATRTCFYRAPMGKK